MELYQLKSFVAVAREENLTRAAKRLHVSQPSVSAHIKSLEDELGLTLFIRTSRGMTMSPEGRIIKAKAESVLYAAETVQNQARELRKDFSGDARIGLNIDAYYLRIPELLSSITEYFPGLKLHFLQKHSLEAFHQVLNGYLDAAFVFVPPDQIDLESQKLASFGVVIVGPYQWKDKLINVDLEGLAGYPWIWTDQSCPFNRIITQLFEPVGRIPEKSVVVDNDSTIRKMVASESGLCLMVEMEARDAAKHKQVVILGEKVSTLDLFVIYLKNRKNTPLLQAIINTMEKVWMEV